jgi:hypothetical protein
MEPISIISDETSIVITISKNAFPPHLLNAIVRSFTRRGLETPHIPYVDDDEQAEIANVLQNPECHIYDDESVI